MSDDCITLSSAYDFNAPSTIAECSIQPSDPACILVLFAFGLTNEYTLEKLDPENVSV